MTGQVVPTHIGLILDGNRRWAKANGLPALKGHEKGYQVLRDVLDHAFERGVKYVSAFVFSTENWNRTKEEVGYLMEFALRTILKDMEELHEKGVRLVWLGSEERVSAKLRDALRRVETLTANKTRGTPHRKSAGKGKKREER